MILAYLHKQEVIFLENNYWDKGRRLGSLIYHPTIGEWQFWPERNAGISVGHIFQIASKLTALNNERQTP